MEAFHRTRRQFAHLQLLLTVVGRSSNAHRARRGVDVAPAASFPFGIDIGLLRQRAAAPG